MRWLVLFVVVVGLAGCATDPAPRAVQQTAIGAAVGVSGGLGIVGAGLAAGAVVVGVGGNTAEASAVRSGVLINAGIGVLVGVTLLSTGAFIMISAQDDLREALKPASRPVLPVPRHSRDDDDDDDEPPRRNTLGFQ